jgi:toxin ParE1/3/4
MKIVWQKKALSELESIYKYIEEESPQNALMVFNAICDLVLSLKIFPYKFPKEPAIESGNVRYMP